MKSGIDACDFDVILNEEIDGHDHDMEYLHGHDHSHKHGAEEHNHQYEHSHEAAEKNVAVHGHDYGDETAAYTHEHHRHHKHRGMNEIRQILADTKMTDSARDIALKIFQILAKAEAKAHNVPVKEVHFHEVGAVDSIVDILSVAVCLTILELRGHCTCIMRRNGYSPLPAWHFTSSGSGGDPYCTAVWSGSAVTPVQGELVTPTGAAIVAAVRTSCKLPETLCN